MFINFNSALFYPQHLTISPAKGLASGAAADIIFDDSSKKSFRAAQNLMRKLAVSQFRATVSVLELKSELA